MKTYNCKNPEENPVPKWLKYHETVQKPVQIKKAEPKTESNDPVELFKKNPNAFFPKFPAYK